MTKSGPIKSYFRKYGLLGFALHAYMGWQGSVFMMPRENVHLWPPYEIPPKAAYFVADVLTPKFLEPPEGRFADTFYKSYLDKKIPSLNNNSNNNYNTSNNSTQTIQNWNAARKQYIDDKVSNSSFKEIKKSYYEFKVPYIESDKSDKYLPGSNLDSTRQQLIKNSISEVPEWIGNRGHPGALGYMVGAYALAEYWKRKHCKKRGDGK